MKKDNLVRIGKSLLQHGKHNDRIYILKMAPDDGEIIFDSIEKLQEKYSYGKIIGKIPESIFSLFEKKGFIREAWIEGFFQRKENVFFMSKFFDLKRSKDQKNEVIPDKKNIFETTHHTVFPIKNLTGKDVFSLKKLYRKVFKTYPFPVHSAFYLYQTMRNNVFYSGIYDRGKLIAAASAETDFKNLNAEMTDFAVLPEYRKKGLASLLLSHLEKRMAPKGIQTFYTIARSASYGMNQVFASASYLFSGKLINNTEINGSIENMNVWFKNYSPETNF